MKKHRSIKRESAASDYSISYSAAVFSISHWAKASVGLGAIACAACAGSNPKPDAVEAPQVFYTVTGEIALARHEPRVASLQYAAAAAIDKEPTLLERAAEVTSESLQPSLTAEVAARWINLYPSSVDAHHAAAKAALALHKIQQSADQYRIVLTTSPRGTDAEFAELETEIEPVDNVFGARQLADRLAASFPGSVAALRLQGFAALRADDPAAAVRSFSAALALLGGEAGAATDMRRELTQGLWRAQILSGDPEEPLVQSRALAEQRPYAREPAQLCAAALGRAARRRGHFGARGSRAPIRIRARRVASLGPDRISRRQARCGGPAIHGIIDDRQVHRRCLLLFGFDRRAARRSGAGVAPVRAGAERRQRGGRAPARVQHSAGARSRVRSPAAARPSHRG